MLHVIFNENSVTVIGEDFSQVFLDSFVYYSTVKQAAINNDIDTIKSLANIYKTMVDPETTLNITATGTLTINNIEILDDSKITKFVKKLHDAGVFEESVEYIKPFIKNMFDNPYIDAVEELYDFCEAQDFVITEDGCFLAYKNVNGDYTSIHDGKTMNAIGTIVEEHAFDTDRNQTCSKGLHFCSKGYLSSFIANGGKTIVVKVNPKDVVAIPTDYNHMKGRCRRYEIVDELKYDTIKEYYRNR